MDENTLEITKKEIASLLEKEAYAEALPLIRQAAYWGDVESQMLAADVALEGLYGTLPNPYAAFDFVKLAALNDQPWYMYKLGDMFSKGLGTASDAAKGFYFMNKAACRQVKEAYDPLAMMYATGNGVEKNPALAWKWIQEAQKAFPDDAGIDKHVRLIARLKEHHGL